MRAPSQRRALGALFLALSALFAGICIAAAAAALDDGPAAAWAVGVAAAAIGLWLLGLAGRALRRQ